MSTLPPVPVAHPLELRERGFQLYAQHKIISEIGEALGVPAATVAGWSSRGKWKARRSAIERAKSDKEAGNTEKAVKTKLHEESVADAETLTFEEKQAEFRDNMATAALVASRDIARMTSDELLRNAEKVKKLHAVGKTALDLEKHKPQIVINVGLLARPINKNSPGAISFPSAQPLPTSETLTLEEHTGSAPVIEAEATVIQHADERTPDASADPAQPQPEA